MTEKVTGITSIGKTADIEYIDRLDVVETYADSLGVLQLRKDGVRIELCVTRPDLNSSTKKTKRQRFPAARLVLTPDAAMELLNHLNKMVNALEQEQRAHAKPPVNKTMN